MKKKNVHLVEKLISEELYDLVCSFCYNPECFCICAVKKHIDRIYLPDDE